MVNSTVNDSSSGPIGFIGFSFLIHGSLAALLAIVPSLRPLPPGTIEMTEIAVISEAAPLGNTPEPVVTELPPAPPEKAAEPAVDVVKKELAAPTPAPVVVKTKAKAPPSELPEKATTTPPPAVEQKAEEAPVVAATPVEVPAEETSAQPELENPEESAAYQEYQKEEADAETAAIADEPSPEESPLVAASPEKSESAEATKTEAAVVAPTRKDARPEALEVAKTDEPSPGPGGGRNGIPEGARLNTDLRQHPGNVPPVYPAVARQNGWEGTVALSYDVSPEGRVENIKVTQSSGYQMLDREAYRAISRYRYLPGQQGKTYHPVMFRLTGPAQALPSRLRTSGASLR